MIELLQGSFLQFSAGPASQSQAEEGVGAEDDTALPNHISPSREARQVQAEEELGAEDEEVTVLPNPISPSTEIRPETPTAESPPTEPTHSFDPFDPFGPQASHTNNSEHDTATNHADDVEVEEFSREDSTSSDTIPPASGTAMQFKPRPFLLPTPPPHLKINWLDGCACQQHGPPFQKPRPRSRKRKRAARSQKKTSDPSPSSNDELLIDLN